MKQRAVERNWERAVLEIVLELLQVRQQVYRTNKSYNSFGVSSPRTALASPGARLSQALIIDENPNPCASQEMIERPVLIIGCPRSGTTLLFNLLSEVSSLWSIGYESKDIIERFHHPSNKEWRSGSLSADDLTASSKEYILDSFENQAAPGTFWRKVNVLRSKLRSAKAWRNLKKQSDRQGIVGATSSRVPGQGLRAIRYLAKVRNYATSRRPESIRLLEKTPENCLRLPFLTALFPDASIIYLTRDGRNNVSSLMEGWRNPNLFPGYRVPAKVNIPGSNGDRWAFTLIPGWRELLGQPLEVVCAWQWIRCNEAVIKHRNQVGSKVPYLTLRYEELIARPSASLQRVADFIGVDYGRELRHYGDVLPRINVVSKPSVNKWTGKNLEAIERVLPLIEPMMLELGYDPSS